MQKEAEKAQKVFEATGLSIEDVTFKNEALAQAMNDSEVSAEQFALMFQEECANVAKKAFGDISLSASSALLTSVAPAAIAPPPAAIPVALRAAALIDAPPARFPAPRLIANSGFVLNLFCGYAQ